MRDEFGAEELAFLDLISELYSEQEFLDWIEKMNETYP